MYVKDVELSLCLGCVVEGLLGCGPRCCERVNESNIDTNCFKSNSQKFEVHMKEFCSVLGERLVHHLNVDLVHQSVLMCSFE